jgi:hypothetical protein
MCINMSAFIVYTYYTVHCMKHFKNTGVMVLRMLYLRTISFIIKIVNQVDETLNILIDQCTSACRIDLCYLSHECPWLRLKRLSAVRELPVAWN